MENVAFQKFLKNGKIRRRRKVRVCVLWKGACEDKCWEVLSPNRQNFIAN